MGLTQDSPQDKINREMFRILYVVRSPDPRGGDLLEQLLNGFERNEANVKKLYTFARQHFNEKGEVLSKILPACEEFLRESMSLQDLESFTKPAPKSGGIFDELIQEGILTAEEWEDIQRKIKET
jgi:hypothetical protein